MTRGEEHGHHLPEEKLGRKIQLRRGGMSSEKDRPVAQGGARGEEDPTEARRSFRSGAADVRRPAARDPLPTARAEERRRT
jgi:hypothetical protein